MGKLIQWMVMVAIAGYLVNHFLLREKTPREIALETAITKINENKGLMIDKYTLLKGAYSSSGGMVITYQLTEYNPLTDRKYVLEQLENNLKPRMCANQAVRDMLAYDVVVSLHYMDPVNKKIGQVTLDQSRCGM